MADLVRAARGVRARLSSDGLESFVKTTGGKGLHVVAPIAPQRVMGGREGLLPRRSRRRWRRPRPTG